MEGKDDLLHGHEAQAKQTREAPAGQMSDNLTYSGATNYLSPFFSGESMGGHQAKSTFGFVRGKRER